MGLKYESLGGGRAALALCALVAVLGPLARCDRALAAAAPVPPVATIGRYFPQERTFGHFGTEPGEFRAPTGIALGPEGHVFVTDYKNNAVLKFDDDGRFVAQILPGEIPFDTPVALAFDSKKNLYVVEEKGCRVRKFNPEGALLATYGGPGAENGKFRTPRGIAINISDHVFVSDQDDHRIQEFDANFAFVRQIRFKDSGRRPALPKGLAIDRENKLWCCFANLHRIVRFDAEGNSDLVAGEEGTGLGQFNEPRYLAFDSQNHVFVTDYLNGRVQQYNTKGEFLFSVGSRGSGRNQFKGPQGITIDTRGNCYIADTDNFRIIVLQINEQLADINQANYLFLTKQYEKALPLYQKVLAKVPLHKESQDRIIEICEILSDKEKEANQLDKARPYLDQILKLQPSNTKALQFTRYILWKNNKGLIYYLTLGTGIFFTFLFLITTLIRILTSD